MTSNLPAVIEAVLKTYAADVKAKFDLPIEFNPEDQLKSPITALFKRTGMAINLKVETVTEVQEAELGRPDVGVAVKGLLAGHVELKAPGKGANPEKLRGGDREQWERFKNLPNLIYTDGNDWALYRNGQLEGKMVRLAGDVSTAGPAAIGPTDAKAILALMQDFLRWEPIVPVVTLRTGQNAGPPLPPAARRCPDRPPKS